MSAASLGVKGIIGRFYATLEQYMGSSWIDMISMLFTSDQASETYKWLGQVPAMREWLGDKQAKGFRDDGITLANKEFEATLEILRKWLRRDKTGQIGIRIGELADRAGGHWEELLSTLIINGTGDTSGLCYDGQYYFDDDHAEGESGTQKNLLTATEVPALDVTTATKPTAAEAADAILGVIAYMMTIKDDRGKPMNSHARKWVVQTGPVLWAALAPAVYSGRVASGESNKLLAIIENSDLEIAVVANPYLTAFTTQFATFRVDAPAKALIRQEEVPVQMKVLGADSEHAFKTRKMLFSAEATRNVTYGYWQYASHATLS